MNSFYSLRRIRLRFWLWVALMLALVAVFAFKVEPQLKVETDLLALLPTTATDVVTHDAVTKFSQALAGKVVLLVGAPQLAQAKAAAAVFADKLRGSAAFSQVTLEQGALSQTMLALYWPHRAYLLSTPQLQLLTTDQQLRLQRDALRAAYTPAGLMRPVSLAQDPLGLATDYLLQQMPTLGAAQLDGNELVIPSHNNTEPYYVLLTAELAGSPFTEQVQVNALAAITSGRAAAAQRIAPAQLDLVMSGTVQHANAARMRAITELNVFGGIETLSVVVLLVAVFNALRPLALGAMTTALAFIAGLCATHFVFGTVHVLALVFGSSLIGGVIDYSIHFFADRFRNDPNWTPVIALEHVGGTIVLGLVTTLLSYVVLLLVPFPGLRQIALFCVAGLTIGCLSVLCAYPVLYRAPNKTREWGPQLGSGLTAWFMNWRWSSTRVITGLLLLACALAGLYQVNLQDDVRALNTSPPALVAAEQRVAALLNTGIESRFFLVQANNEQALLEKEEQLTLALAGLKTNNLLSGYTAITRSLPSLQRQHMIHEQLTSKVLNPNGALPQLLQQLGFAANDIDTRVAEFTSASTSLTVDDWLHSAASTPYRDLWLGNSNDHYATIVSLVGVKDVAALRQVAAATQGVQLIDRVNAVSEVLRSYRLAMSWLLCVVYVATWLLLGFKYGWREAPLILVPSALASAVTVGLFGWFGVPVNLFVLLALWLVLGLGVDYGIFLRHGHTAMPTAVLSVTLSATTTLLAFGLLAFSATPFIRSIGLTLLFSISLSWLFAMLSCLTLNSAIPHDGSHT